MSIVHVMDHPLIQHKLSLMRDQETGPKEFRELLNEISMLMAYEVTRDLPLKTIEIETPICRAQTQVIAGKKLAIVPILRAGLGMVDGIMSLVPAAKVGHIGLYRDPNTLEPVEYYCKLPADAQEREILLVDPMLATGGSASAAIGFLKKRGCKNIKLVNLRGGNKLRACRRIIRTWISTWRAWTRSSTTTAISFRVWATRATASSAPNKAESTLETAYFSFVCCGTQHFMI